MQNNRHTDVQTADEELLQRVAQQDVAAYELLYDRHTQAVYSLILRIVRQPNRAEDLLQETFWQVWRSASAYRGEGAAVAWLLRVARNRALDELRRQKARPQADESVGDDQARVDQMERAMAQAAPLEDAVATTVARRWNQQQVQLALAEIPADQRLCLELSYFEGMSQREIAEYLNLPVGTIKSRMRIGMEKLEYQLRIIGFP
ncbi:MAG: sigma-70 family RNA polymerase sigma factor [Caldilineaceae bacterium]